MKQHSHHSEDHHSAAKKVAHLEHQRPETISFEEVQQLLDLQPSDRVADLGAGTGFYAFPMARVTREVLAIDVDQHMITYLNDKIAKLTIDNLQPLHGSLLKLPIRDHSVDKVLASLSLHEVTPLPHALAEVYRVLKPNGQFLCVEIKDDGQHAHNAPRIEQQELQQLLVDQGFTVTAKRSTSHKIYVLVAQR